MWDNATGTGIIGGEGDYESTWIDINMGRAKGGARISIAEIPMIGSAIGAGIGEINSYGEASWKTIGGEGTGAINSAYIDIIIDDGGIVAAIWIIANEGYIEAAIGGIIMCRAGKRAGVSITEIPKIGSGVCTVVGKVNIKRIATDSCVSNEGCGGT